LFVVKAGQQAEKELDEVLGELETDAPVEKLVDHKLGVGVTDMHCDVLEFRRHFDLW